MKYHGVTQFDVSTGAFHKAPAKAPSYTAVFGKTVEKLSSVSRPTADDARLLKWFTQLGVVQAKLRALGVALKANEEIKAAHEQIRVERAANAANNYSFVFDFHYCHLTPSRFT